MDPPGLPPAIQLSEMALCGQMKAFVNTGRVLRTNLPISTWLGNIRKTFRLFELSNFVPKNVELKICYVLTWPRPVLSPLVSKGNPNLNTSRCWL